MIILEGTYYRTSRNLACKIIKVQRFQNSKIIKKYGCQHPKLAKLFEIISLKTSIEKESFAVWVLCVGNCTTKIVYRGFLMIWIQFVLLFSKNV